MFEELVPSVVVVLVTVTLVALVLLATVLDSLGRRCRASQVVALMGTTSVTTACLTGLLVLCLMYGPIGGNSTHRGYGTASALERVRANDKEDAASVPATGNPRTRRSEDERPITNPEIPF
jgi:hypothetical protein